MKHPVYSFNIYQGADEEFPFTFCIENDGVEIPVNFSGCSFIMTLRQSLNKPVIDVLTSDNGRISLGVINDNTFTQTDINPNTILVKFPHELTSQFVFPTAIYDLFKIDSSGYREVLLQGTITIDKSVCYG